jgi:hypothetical protein
MGGGRRAVATNNQRCVATAMRRIGTTPALMSCSLFEPRTGHSGGSCISALFARWGGSPRDMPHTASNAPHTPSCSFPCLGVLCSVNHHGMLPGRSIRAAHHQRIGMGVYCKFQTASSVATGTMYTPNNGEVRTKNAGNKDTDNFLCHGRRLHP